MRLASSRLIVGLCKEPIEIFAFKTPRCEIRKQAGAKSVTALIGATRPQFALVEKGM